MGMSLNIAVTTFTLRRNDMSENTVNGFLDSINNQTSKKKKKGFDALEDEFLIVGGKPVEIVDEKPADNQTEKQAQDKKKTETSKGMEKKIDRLVEGQNTAHNNLQKAVSEIKGEIHNEMSAGLGAIGEQLNEIMQSISKEAVNVKESPEYMELLKQIESKDAAIAEKNDTLGKTADECAAKDEKIEELQNEIKKLTEENIKMRNAIGAVIAEKKRHNAAQPAPASGFPLGNQNVPQAFPSETPPVQSAPSHVQPYPTGEVQPTSQGVNPPAPVRMVQPDTWNDPWGNEAPPAVNLLDDEPKKKKGFFGRR